MEKCVQRFSTHPAEEEKGGKEMMGGGEKLGIFNDVCPVLVGGRKFFFFSFYSKGRK